MLTRLVHHVREVALGDATSFTGGVLSVSADQAGALFEDSALAGVKLTWASPGQSTRIVKVLDSVEPRTKGPGGGGIFPGWVGRAVPQGHGETHVLRGAAVVAAGFLPRAQEAVVDMSGPAAELSPLGSTHNLVVEFTPADGAPWEAVEAALRRGTLALAVHLADAALEADPDEREELAGPAGPGGRTQPAGPGGRTQPSTKPGDLPRVGAITNLQTQGAFKDVFVYGRSFSGGLPTLLDPGELDDGAVVSGQYGHPALKNPTFVHQNHPVVNELRRRHGDDLQFAGLVISPEPVNMADKQLVSIFAARVCAAAGFDAVVITKEGGGNADADMALKMDALEEMGITAVGLFGELAGSDGTGPSLVVPPEKATAMVSTGNYDSRLTLPAVETALGGEDMRLLEVPATDELELPAAVVYCSLSPLGWGRNTATAAP